MSVQWLQLLFFSQNKGQTTTARRALIYSYGFAFLKGEKKPSFFSSFSSTGLIFNRVVFFAAVTSPLSLNVHQRSHRHIRNSPCCIELNRVGTFFNDGWVEFHCYFLFFFFPLEIHRADTVTTPRLWDGAGDIPRTRYRLAAGSSVPDARRDPNPLKGSNQSEVLVSGNGLRSRDSLLRWRQGINERKYWKNFTYLSKKVIILLSTLKSSTLESLLKLNYSTLVTERRRKLNLNVWIVSPAPSAAPQPMRRLLCGSSSSLEPVIGRRGDSSLSSSIWPMKILKYKKKRAHRYIKKKQ